MDLTAVNSLSDANFINKFRNVIEKYEPCAHYLNSLRPFQDEKCLQEAVDQFFNQLTTEEIEEILYLHPDLVGKVAEETYLTCESQSEQRLAGLREISDQETEHLRKLNAKYREKFGFPFIICARENKLASIFKGLKERLSNEREIEIQTALSEVRKISSYRVSALLKE